MQEVMDRCIVNYRKTTGIELRMAIDPDNFLSNELYVGETAVRLFCKQSFIVKLRLRNVVIMS